jgi:hypothetical protein
MAFEPDPGSRYNLLKFESATPEDNGTAVAHVAMWSTIVVSNPVLAPTGVRFDLVDRARAVGRGVPPATLLPKNAATLSEHVPRALSRVASLSQFDGNPEY